MELSPETAALLERAQRAIDEAQRLREENIRLAGIANQRGYIMERRLSRSPSEK